jgi:hypothetical protein
VQWALFYSHFACGFLVSSLFEYALKGIGYGASNESIIIHNNNNELERTWK